MRTAGLEPRAEATATKRTSAALTPRSKSPWIMMSAPPITQTPYRAEPREWRTRGTARTDDNLETKRKAPDHPTLTKACDRAWERQGIVLVNRRSSKKDEFVFDCGP